MPGIWWNQQTCSHCKRRRRGVRRPLKLIGTDIVKSFEKLSLKILKTHIRISRIKSFSLKWLKRIRKCRRFQFPWRILTLRKHFFFRLLKSQSFLFCNTHSFFFSSFCIRSQDSSGLLSMTREI